jgi:hypothetical protein
VSVRTLTTQFSGIHLAKDGGTKDTKNGLEVTGA